MTYTRASSIHSMLTWFRTLSTRFLVIFSIRLITYTAVGCLVLGGCPAVVSGQAVTTHFNDPNRTGTNPSETTLTTSNVNVDTFGKLFSRSVDGQIYAQPLYVPDLDIPGRGVHNVVFVATEHNSVYAYDADTPSESTPLWHVSLGPAVPIAVLDITDDIIIEIGITSTPVIDLTSNTLYVVAQSYEGGAVIFRLHALDIKTGLARAGSPAVIAGSVPGTALDSVGGVLTFDPRMQLQRPGLLLLNGRIYIGFGSHNDLKPYHGWVFGYDATTLQQTGIQCLTPHGQGAGIWQGGVGLAADSAGNIYVQTGHSEQVTSGIAYGSSLIKLSTPDLAVVDYFTPSNSDLLNQFDIDYGASGPILIPGTSFVVGGGKDGRIFLNDTNDLGQFNAVNQVTQEWQATYSALSGPGGLFARNVFYNSTLYLWGRFDTAKAFAFQGSLFNTTPISQSTFNVPDGYANEPGMSISANGTTPGTGILWAAYSSTGASNGGAFPGILSALDASDLSRELWNSNQNPTRDYSGSWAKWSPPTVANGKVYLASFDNVLNVYGLITAGAAASVTATAGTPQSTVINASFAATLQATVRDVNEILVSGVTVTFTAPASGASGAFGGVASAAAVSDTSGIATAPAFTANEIVGGFEVTASVAGVPTPATFNLTNVAVGASGSLAGAVTTSTAAVNLTTEGSADWVHWNVAGLTRKAGVTAQLSTYTMVGTGPVLTYADDLRAISWTGGTPTASGSNSREGVYIRGIGNGFSFTAPADTTTRRLIVHVGGYLSGGRLLAHLSDGSAMDFSDTSATDTNVNDNYDRNYTLTYKAASAGQLLTVTWVMTSASGVGNVSLSATALSLVGVPSSIVATAGTPQSATINTAFATALQATVQDAGSNPVAGITVTFTAPGSGASGSFGGAASVNAVTDASGVATAPTLTANGTTGTYSVTANTAGVATPAAFSLTNTPLGGGGGSLTGTVTTSTAAVNLTTEGTADWEHWRVAGLTRKAGVTAQLSSYTMVGTGPVLTYSDDLRLISWTGGTPAASGSNSKEGVFIRASGNGFSFTAPADTTNRQLIVHVGGYLSGGRLTAHLSDASVVDYSDTAPTDMNVNDNYDRNYTLTYRAASAGQLLTVTWVMTSGGGNVSLSAAALSVIGAPTGSIVATAGTPQSTTINTAFATALKATVQDGSSAPVPGVTVTFTAPGSGASGNFSGVASVSATTDASGVATAPTFTANGTVGSYSVTASTAGVATPASFSLTNTAAPAASVTATAGTPQSTTINTAFATALKATVQDGSSAPVPGVTVTFTAPGSGASGNFSGVASVSATTDASGVATAPTFTANGTAGSYSVTASVAGVATPASFSLTNTAAPAASVTATAGTPQSATINTAFATALKATVRNASSAPVPGVTVTFTAPGSGASGNFSGVASVSATTDASGVATAPTFTANGTVGSYSVTASTAGVATPASFSLTNTAAPAASVTATAGTPQSATINTAFATALKATVRNASSAPVPGVTVTFTAPGSGASGNFSGVASVSATTDASGVATAPTFTANGTVGSYSVTASTAGVATPASFSLTNTAAPAASVTATAGTPQSATINTAFATALKATVRNASSAPVPGVTVTFTAPGSGASGNFSGVASVSATTDASGVATAPTFTANGTAGSYSVTASVAGVATPANFSLTNTAVGGGGGSIAGAVTTSTAAINLTTEGSADWVHWSVAGLTRKAGVPAQLSSYTMVGTGPVLTYSDDLRLISWTGGTPTASGTNSKEGVYIRGIGNGFSFTAPADTTTRRLIVHVGGYLSGGRLTAHLSDGSAVDYSDTAATDTNVNDNYDRNYTLTYRAASAGQLLTVTWVMTSASGVGNVSLSAAALSLVGVPSSIVATAGTPQSATINTVFATALQATVRDAGSNPVSGVMVTFTAPSGGASASGSFGGVVSVSATTNGSGIATAPALTANGIAGSYSVTASTAGVAMPATFSLTNTPVGASGSLSGAVTTSTAAVNLTTEGSVDWVHWRVAGLTRKAGVTAQLSSYTMVGTGPVLTYSDDLRPISWTGGTPTASGTNSKEGVYIRGIGNGFSFTAPADTTSRRLIVHVGGYLSGGQLTARLSDGSAVDYSDTAATDTNVNDNYDRNYTLTYRAASAGQLLTVTWVMTSASGVGNVSLSAAALSVGP